MQGYFSYRLFGTKEELESALETLNKKAKNETDIKQLINWTNDDEKYVHTEVINICLLWNCQVAEM